MCDDQGVLAGDACTAGSAQANTTCCRSMWCDKAQGLVTRQIPNQCSILELPLSSLSSTDPAGHPWHEGRWCLTPQISVGQISRQQAATARPELAGRTTHCPCSPDLPHAKGWLSRTFFAYCSGLTNCCSVCRKGRRPSCTGLGGVLQAKQKVHFNFANWLAAHCLSCSLKPADC